MHFDFGAGLVAGSAKQNQPIFYWKLAYFLLKLDNKKICLLGYQAYFCWQWMWYLGVDNMEKEYILFV